MLGRLLQYEINEEKVTDVHDRALLYYRLLVKGVPEVRDTVCLVVLSAIQTVFSSSGQEGPFCPKKHCRHGRAGPHPGTARFRLPRVQLPFSDLRSHRRDLYCSGASLRQGAPCRCWKHVWDFLRNLFRANNNIFSPAFLQILETTKMRWLVMFFSLLTAVPMMRATMMGVSWPQSLRPPLLPPSFGLLRDPKWLPRSSNNIGDLFRPRK